MEKKKIWTRLFKMLGSYKKTIILPIILSIFVTLINTAIPILQQNVIDKGLMKYNINVLAKLTVTF